MIDDARLEMAFSGLHPIRSRELRDRFGGASAAVSAISRGRAKASEAIRTNLAVPADQRRAELNALGIDAVFRNSLAYPDHLDLFEDAPDVLFVRGALPLVPGVGIVGTRKCTAYGLELAEAYGRAVAETGWLVMSGLARGIDGAAHRGMVSIGGVGVAVLGCGIDVTYPREHRRLGEQILEAGGAIVSEYPPGSRPDAWRFPPRNRIIAGLSAAVVVVEAARTGGALITAVKAAEYGIPVFAMPGDVDRRTSEGTNRLIRDGAFPVLDPDDLIEELDLVYGLAHRQRKEDPVDRLGC
ncbi:MAG: DNA-processing protein DprA [Actinomycetota bacterium]|nr:DNA-processing protein DprA [Actinomycetota bacterium]